MAHMWSRRGVNTSPNAKIINFLKTLCFVTLAYVFLCVGTHVWEWTYTHTHACRGQRSMQWSSSTTLPPYFWDSFSLSLSLTEPEAPRFCSSVCPMSPKGPLSPLPPQHAQLLLKTWIQESKIRFSSMDVMYFANGAIFPWFSLITWLHSPRAWTL